LFSKEKYSMNRERKKEMNRKIVAAVIAVIVFIGGGTWYFIQKSSNSDVDLTKNVKISFKGLNKAGSVDELKKNLPDAGSDARLKDFYDSISFEVEPNSYLENGQKIKVKAEYSRARAQELGIRISNDVKYVTVSGLKKRLEKKDVTPEMMKLAQEKTLHELRDVKYIENPVLTSTYLANCDNDRDYIVTVYKETNDGDVNYYMCFASACNDMSLTADVLKDDDKAYIDSDGPIRYTDEGDPFGVNNNTYVKNESQVEEGIKFTFAHSFQTECNTLIRLD
jgi:hypothetical protein